MIVMMLLCLGSIRLANAQTSSKKVWNYFHLVNGNTQNNINSRVKKLTADTLVLPFWDDFSYANTNSTRIERYVADSSLWADGSQTVRINTGLAINPPTVGIATFDGVDQNGMPYSQVQAEEGLADSLVSLPINLAVIPTNERQSVYFSFFWQRFGRGEFPDPEDSIRLQFKNAQNQWITQWSMSGGDTVVTELFEQEMIQVINPGFYHSGFQFRFQSYSRLSGAYDTWNIDYVYLNSGRTPSNTAYLDRALASLPESPFGKYTAVPMKQFAASPESYLGNTSVEFYNLNVQLQPVRFTALLRDQMSGNIIQVLNDDNALSPIPPGLERRTITADPLDINNILSLDQDSLFIETEFHITSGDNYLIEEILPGDTVFNTQVDYRVNDTVRTTYVLDEYFAYDDGEAEFGVEINQNGGKVAYQFNAPQKDLLTHVDIYFPPLTRNQASVPFQLMVWKTLEDSIGEEVILRAQQSQSTADQLNEFISIELSSPVVVEDTFYIGYEQQGESFIAIGFDKNTDATSKIFYNVTGAWAQDSTLNGSLMMRPRFDKNRNVNAIDEPVVEKHADLLVFPNPTHGSFRLNKAFEEIIIYDAAGKIVKQIKGGINYSGEIVTDLPSGIYLLKIGIDDKHIIRKLIVH
ncbi:hypothetical protein OKW21_002067 [Catalinimonas alkaloidigena]|uniref:T9SS type A sorting domain-containing protein n=1 Tax=Catalinimonas alkaloidigena TaxID=1075417 RepID=UPI0024075B79|nr:T9SS type A sorting domain-containing protein [Catalinimonas alkaloidigena]MDF9796804.1 hypothetical protein [Catalinimonas alkaloidigena]